jgi:hypothetical protein
MASKDKELTVEEAAKLAYERSNASLKDYDPSKLADKDKVKERTDVADINVRDAAPQEPVQVRADTLLPPRGRGDHVTK